MPVDFGQTNVIWVSQGFFRKQISILHYFFCDKLNFRSKNWIVKGLWRVRVGGLGLHEVGVQHWGEIRVQEIREIKKNLLRELKLIWKIKRHFKKSKAVWLLTWNFGVASLLREMQVGKEMQIVLNGINYPLFDLFILSLKKDFDEKSFELIPVLGTVFPLNLLQN